MVLSDGDDCETFGAVSGLMGPCRSDGETVVKRSFYEAGGHVHSFMVFIARVQA